MCLGCRTDTPWLIASFGCIPQTPREDLVELTVFLVLATQQFFLAFCLCVCMCEGQGQGLGLGFGLLTVSSFLVSYT